nr:MAG TPA: integrase [Caudoviricetes sp.]
MGVLNMSIYAYYRVSTQTQAEQNGIEMQMNEIARYCKKKGITLADSFKDEGISGTRADREGLNDLLATLEKGDKVIVQNTSRLWRNDSVKVMVHHEMKKCGADIISVEQPTYSINSKDPNDFLFNGMMELLDQYERMTISMKLAKGRKARAKTGNKPCGTAPYGYKWQGNNIVVDFNNNLVVKDIFEKYTQLRSLAKLKEYCDGKGYKTSTGKDFSKQSLKNIIENDFYVGVVTYAGKKIEGEHKALIEKALFDKANEILKR